MTIIKLIYRDEHQEHPRGLEAKIEAVWREVSRMSEVQKGAIKKAVPKKHRCGPHLRLWNLPGKDSQPWPVAHRGIPERWKTRPITAMVHS